MYKKLMNFIFITIKMTLFILLLVGYMFTISCYLFDWSDDASPAIDGDDDDDDDDEFDEEGPSCEGSDGKLHGCTEVITYLFNCGYTTYGEKQSVVIEHCHQGDSIKVCAVNCYCEHYDSGCDTVMNCADTCL